MKIEILGSGCKKCSNLAADVEQVAHELSMEFTIEKVTDMAIILEYGVMSTPAIAIDGNVVAAGAVPSHAEIKQLLNQASKA
ncbi:thioredoxin family protein [Shewanella donghaensis]|uniref:thioredoxin family protein n=1 Tax=Shewanella donghaensis TaxID=238836 RepID=UPI0011839D1E|nr:thioredoxin family protein [Shewanella donghaensis]